MLSAIIAAHESEQSLVPTLAALVPGATAGLLKEVIIADAGSMDATAEIADVAGCRFISSDEPLGVRLRIATERARGQWFLFLRAGMVIETGWTGVASYFMETIEQRNAASAAVFRRMAATPSGRAGWLDLIALLNAKFRHPRPEQGLLIPRILYDQIGGHRDEAQAEAALLRRLGRRRITTLQTGVWQSPIVMVRTKTDT